MADIRCPMCGKSNPDHLEICQFCEARLTPLAPPKSSDNLNPQKDGADLPEWLNLDWDANLDPEESPSTEDESDAQEWLDRIRADVEPEETDAQPLVGDADSERATTSEEGTEWLNRIRNLHQSDQETQAGDFEEQAEPVDTSGSSPTQDDDLDLDGTAFDFLSSLVDDEPGVGESEPKAAISQVGDEDIPDWLSSLGTESYSEPTSAKDSTGSETVSASAGEDIPDWLSSMGIESPDEDISSSEVSPARDSDVPDWLSDIGINRVEAQATTTPSTEDDDIPAWISEMGIDQDAIQEAEDTAEPISQAFEGDMPDWLSSLGGSGDTAEELRGRDQNNSKTSVIGSPI
jgi:hypothetical protein